MSESQTPEIAPAHAGELRRECGPSSAIESCGCGDVAVAPRWKLLTFAIIMAAALGFGASQLIAAKQRATPASQPAVPGASAHPDGAEAHTCDPAAAAACGQAPATSSCGEAKSSCSCGH